MRVLITGGAGFVGSNLSGLFAKAGHRVTAFDNLKRRGSELNLPMFKKLGIEFVHGDIRNPHDFESLEQSAHNGVFDVLVEASAEPSVHAGLCGGLDYLLETNLLGTYHALEYAKRKVKKIIFLSTSRVYSLDALRNIPLSAEGHDRFQIDSDELSANPIRGLSRNGIDEDFEVQKAKSFYGFTKYASEQLILEYVHNLKMDVVINRCGVIAGPGQFGKVDQGVFTLWVARHLYGGALSYTGFGGLGQQVRDILHPKDLFQLIETQISHSKSLAGELFCAGGGLAISTSLAEYTTICQSVTGRKIDIRSNADTNPMDAPWICMDSTRAQRELGWTPKISVQNIVKDIYDWLQAGGDTTKSLFV